MWTVGNRPDIPVHENSFAIFVTSGRYIQTAIDQCAHAIFAFRSQGYPIQILWHRKDDLRLNGFVLFSCPSRDVYEV